MKTQKAFLTSLLVIGSIIGMGVNSAKAASAYWNVTSGNVSNQNNWKTGAGGGGATILPGASDTALVGSGNVNGSNISLTVDQNSTWGNLTIRGAQTGTTTFTAGSAGGSTLTLGQGVVGSEVDIITVQNGAGAVTIGQPGFQVNITNQAAADGSEFTIRNGSANNLTINGNVSANLGASTGTITYFVRGSNGGTTIFNGAVTDQDLAHTQKLALFIGNGAQASLNAANAFTGATTDNGVLTLGASGALTGTAVTVNKANGNGTASLIANAAGAIGAGTSVLVNSGGSLIFGANNAVDSTATISLAGGTIVMNGTTQTIGSLTLVSGVNTIDLSQGGGGKLTLTDITWTAGATLVINGWQGTSLYEGDANHYIELGAGAQAAIEAHEGDISWTNLNGPVFGSVVGGQVAGSQLVPVPEPSTIVGGLCLLGLLAWSGRRRVLSVVRA